MIPEKQNTSVREELIVDCIEDCFRFVDVERVLAEKELEARRKVLEERRLREEARLAQSSQTPQA